MLILVPSSTRLTKASLCSFTVSLRPVIPVATVATAVYSGAYLDFPLANHRRRLAGRIDLLLKDIIQAKFAEQQQARSQSQSKADTKRNRSVLSLSLQQTDHLNPGILQQTCDQLKSSLFAGHDTTSILLQWAFYELSRTPRVLKAIRRELDDIFGSDSSSGTVRQMLCLGSENIILRMSYVSAVAKEILRFYPPSGTARYMNPGSGFKIQLLKTGELMSERNGNLQMRNACASRRDCLRKYQG